MESGTYKLTMELRWIKKGRVKKLQQKAIEINSGHEEWIDIPKPMNCDFTIMQKKN